MFYLVPTLCCCSFARTAFPNCINWGDICLLKNLWKWKGRTSLSFSHLSFVLGCPSGGRQPFHWLLPVEHSCSSQTLAIINSTQHSSLFWAKYRFCHFLVFCLWASFCLKVILIDWTVITAPHAASLPPPFPSLSCHSLSLVLNPLSCLRLSFFSFLFFQKLLFLTF